MTALILFIGLTLTMLTGLGLAAAAIREDRRRFKDELPDIQAELALNAKIRELQGVTRVGDELTERYESVEHVGRVRQQVAVYDEAAGFDMEALLAIKPKLKNGKIMIVSVRESGK